jgi:leucyl aminopeptidase (aminopeptidase T)
MVSFEAAVREAKLVIDHCYSVKKGDNVAILTDQDHMGEAKALAAVAGQVGGSVVLLDASDYVQAGMLTAGIPEPPSHISSLMEKTQVFIIKTEMDFAHRFAHTDASRIVERNKGRIASVEEDMGTWGIDYAYLVETKERTAKLGAITGKGDKVRITSAKGTDVTFSIKNRPALVIVPQRAPGDVMSPLPLWGEVAHSIIEDSGNGVVVADGIANAVANNGLKEPITYSVKNGRAYDIRGGDEAKKWKAIVDSADENANVLCEFAVGTGRRERWNTVSEKGALGTMHLAIGENAGPYPGGKNHSKIHLDVTIRFPTIEVDGKVVAEKGGFKFDQKS